jgi:hypothetical protein
MLWRIFSLSPSSGALDAVIELGCVVTRTEDEARGCAMRLYRDGMRRVMVRPPGWRTTVSGAALQAWLIDRQAGEVLG